MVRLSELFSDGTMFTFVIQEPGPIKYYRSREWNSHRGNVSILYHFDRQ